MIPPIPKKLLIHSAKLITEFDTDKWGNSTTQSEEILENIRIEPSSEIITDSFGTALKLSAVLFFDGRNSRPQEINFALKGDVMSGKTVKIQRVEFGGRLFTVASVTPLFADGNKIHHYEVGLM